MHPSREAEAEAASKRMWKERHCWLQLFSEAVEAAAAVTEAAAAVEACALSIFSCFFFQQPQPLNDNGLNVCTQLLVVTLWFQPKPICL